MTPPSLPPTIHQQVTHHARERMVERLGRDATPDEWVQIIGAIVDRAAVLLGDSTPPWRDGTRWRREIWAVPLGGLTLKVVWAPDTAALITVLGDGSASNVSPRQRQRHEPQRAPELKRWFGGSRLRSTRVPA